MTAAQESKRVIIELKTKDKSSEASARGVGGLMMGIAALAEDIHKEFDSNNELVIKARPFTKGSLEIPMDFILLGGALTLLQYPNLIHILEAVRKYFEVKHLLKGKSPHKGEDGLLVVENCPVKIEELTINMVGPQSVGDQLICQAFQSLEKDCNVEEVRILAMAKSGKKRVVAKIKQEHFVYYSAGTEIHGPQDRFRRDPEATLLVISPVLSGAYVWRFAYHGKAITARVTDEDFNARIEHGESFAAGDSLIAEVDILQRYDTEDSGYKDHQYTVRRVFRHVKRAEDLFQK